MAKFGLIGKNIDYSFSRKYFSEKFEKEGLPHSYENFDLSSLAQFPEILKKNPDLKGLNVTIPYKERIMAYLDALDAEAEKIGAVNTIKISEGGRLIGYNTDHFGFAQALMPYLPLRSDNALILGTGGASKAVAFALRQLGFNFHFVSRNPTSGQWAYAHLDGEIVQAHSLIVNSTPLGTAPHTSRFPSIPYELIGAHHLLFDLIYNPAESEFLRRGKERGAKTTNGLQMLVLQAEKAWEIWRS